MKTFSEDLYRRLCWLRELVERGLMTHAEFMERCEEIKRNIKDIVDNSERPT